MSEIIVKKDVLLPALPSTVLPAIDQLMAVLDIPRDFLASAEEIEYAWSDLPRELKNIPGDLRNELIARMCIAVSSGLFDGAMNYAWNAAILRLRQKIRTFGLPVVAQIQQNDFEEKHLLELQDSRLLDLCLKLNIVNEDGFFFLNQCREVRNNFSAAHPAMGTVNNVEFATFLNRCVKYALADSLSPKGVNISDFISAVQGQRFNKDQCSAWVNILTETHDAQRQMLVNMAHGIYCDPVTAEHARLNSFDVCYGLKDMLTASIKSELINNHSEYVAKGAEDKRRASLLFFQKLDFLALLNEHEQHVVFSRAIENLWNVHNGINNFYNEPPFAERLLDLSGQSATPETIQEQFVQVVACCGSGNGYGVSNAAIPYYNKIIKGFSPGEIAILIKSAVNKLNPLGSRMGNKDCRKNFKELLLLIDADSIPKVVKADYEKLLRPGS